MDKTINKAVSELQYSLTINFIEKLDILMKLQDNSEDNEVSNLVRYTRSTKDLKLHFLLDDIHYKNSAENVFANFFNTFTNTNINLQKNIKTSLYKSYISLFSIESVNPNTIILYDMFLKEKIEIVNKGIDNFSKNTFIFGRIATFNNFNYIIHILNYLNTDMSDIFYTLFFEYISLNLTKTTTLENKIKLLKQNSIDLFIVFGLALDSYEEINFKLKSDGEKEYLKINLFNGEDIIIFDNFIEYIIEYTDIDDDYIFYILEIIYNNYLAKINENFSTIKNYSFEDIFNNLTGNGDFLTKEDFYNSLFILKKMYFYFKENNIDTSKAINELENISNNIFIYQKNLNNSTKGFYFDESLLNIIPDMIDFTININFREFLKYIELMHVTKSETKDALIPTHLKNLSNELNLEPTKNVKNLNQSHYPLIDFFYNFAKEKSLIEIENTFVQPTKKIDDYLKLPENEAYALFIQSILNKNFINSFIDKEKYNLLIFQIKAIISHLIIEDTEISDLNLKKDRMFILDCLQRFNLIEISENNIHITELGKKIYNFYLENASNNSKVINLFNYKKDLS